jgi:hypothetical protein
MRTKLYIERFHTTSNIFKIDGANIMYGYYKKKDDDNEKDYTNRLVKINFDTKTRMDSCIINF